MGKWILIYKSENIDLQLEGECLIQLICKGRSVMQEAYEAYNKEE